MSSSNVFPQGSGNPSLGRKIVYEPEGMEDTEETRPSKQSTADNVHMNSETKAAPVCSRRGPRAETERRCGHTLTPNPERAPANNHFLRKS